MNNQPKNGPKMVVQNTQLFEINPKINITQRGLNKFLWCFILLDFSMTTVLVDSFRGLSAIFDPARWPCVNFPTTRELIDPDGELPAGFHLTVWVS